MSERRPPPPEHRPGAQPATIPNLTVIVLYKSSGWPGLAQAGMGWPVRAGMGRHGLAQAEY